MKLGDIIACLAPLQATAKNTQDIQVIPGAPRVDNRLVSRGDIFICIKGFSSDGHKFVPDAVSRGASLIISMQDLDITAPYIKVNDTRKAAALIAKLYYGNPSGELTMIGITGTNGKTTTSLVIYQALCGLGLKAGWIGTLGYYLEGNLHKTLHTTPDIFELNDILAQMRAAGTTHVVMEVSSHAIALDRIYGLEFDYCLFSNLSREHLDFHKTMEEYAETKYSFLEKYAALGATALVNSDDAFGRIIIDRLAGTKCRSVGQNESDYQLRKVILKPESSSFELSINGYDRAFRSKLIGGFNVANLALACATLMELGYDPEQVARVIAEINPVKGRFERVPNNYGIGVFVDYAHSPDAIENILKSCKEISHNRLLCLIGAGGNRDKGKRPLMLQSALHNCDAVIISDDNPREEDPRRIISDMLVGTDLWFPWWIIRDRKLAIEAILRLAHPGDIVVICGKGHENYQEIEGVRHDFDDYQVAYQYLDGVKGIEDGDELVLPVDEMLLKLLSEDRTEYLEFGYHEPKCYRKISTDSRRARSGSLFFAIKGERFDGNDYIDSVITDKPNMAIGSIEHSGDRYLYHDDPLLLMARICRKYLQLFPAYKVALTGSTGKSGTKEYLAAVLGAKAKTLKTLSNENNLIGLCQTILRIKPDDQYAVFELGTNHFGEIRQLSETCQPDSSLIINIGPSHLEHLVNEDGVFEEKRAIFDRSLQYRLYPADDPRFTVYSSSGLSVGYSEQADFRISGMEIGESSTRFMINQYTFKIAGTIPHNVSNSAFAIAMALCLGQDPDLIQQGLDSIVPLPKRMEIIQLGSGILIADCYNANPVSMQKAIEYWRAITPEKPHKAILGDMLELGENSETYHQMIGAMLSEVSFEDLITVGTLSKHYKPENLSGYRHYDEVSSLADDFDIENYCKDSIVLVKSSHGIHLEKLLSKLGERN
jgi:UDP-N-acetylmuramyl-tripeptide synthetase/UDP-N-acetylmuramoyl-tripeptide--D-alanyl-D-alanine ligase